MCTRYKYMYVFDFVGHLNLFCVCLLCMNNLSVCIVMCMCCYLVCLFLNMIQSVFHII